MNARQSDPVTIEGGWYDVLEIYATLDLSWVEFKNCVIVDLYVDQNKVKASTPVFNRCHIERLHGAVSREDLPTGMIDPSCEIGDFQNDLDTSSDIRQQPLSPAVRVLLVSFRKLFIQAGKGRKENAFSRGLDDVEKAYVQDVLSLISKFGFARPQRLSGPPVWLPNRTRSAEALAIMRAPQQSSADILQECRQL